MIDSEFYDCVCVWFMIDCVWFYLFCDLFSSCRRGGSLELTGRLLLTDKELTGRLLLTDKKGWAKNREGRVERCQWGVVGL
jgi:hypothetical protein